MRTNGSMGAAAFVLAATAASADVLIVDDKDEWLSLVGEVTTVDFTGYASGVFITDQYQGLGVLFTDGDDQITVQCPQIYPNDTWGCQSFATPFVLEFVTPQSWLAVEFPGNIKLRLFAAGEQIFVSPVQGVGGPGNFAGLVTTDPFDEVHIEDFDDWVFADDIHFGPRLPGDANGDAVVNVEDLIDVIQALGAMLREGRSLPGRRHPRRHRQRR